MPFGATEFAIRPYVGRRRGTRLMFLDQQPKVIVTFAKAIRFSSGIRPAATSMYAQNVG